VRWWQYPHDAGAKPSSRPTASVTANASVVHVCLEVRDAVLRVCVREDGHGGADPARGSGLISMTDRAEAIGGTLRFQSPIASGATLVVELPLEHENE
jgi:signal transduction histidine kinase